VDSTIMLPDLAETEIVELDGLRTYVCATWRDWI